MQKKNWIKMEAPVGILDVGTVIWIKYPFEDKNGSKFRPAVILGHDNGKTKAVVLKISSVTKYDDNEKYPYAHRVRDIISSELKDPSYVLTDKELIIPENMKCERIGILSQEDLKRVNALHNVAVLRRKNVTQTL